MQTLPASFLCSLPATCDVESSSSKPLVFNAAHSPVAYERQVLNGPHFRVAQPPLPPVAGANYLCVSLRLGRRDSEHDLQGLRLRSMDGPLPRSPPNTVRVTLARRDIVLGRFRVVPLPPPPGNRRRFPALLLHSAGGQAPRPQKKWWWVWVEH